MTPEQARAYFWGTPQRVIKRFFEDNPPEYGLPSSVDVDVIVCGERPRFLDFDEHVREEIVESVRRDTRTVSRDQGLSFWECMVMLHGEDYSLVFGLRHTGRMVFGGQGRYEITNPSLVKALARVYDENGLLDGYSGRCLRQLLKQAGGEKAEESEPPGREVKSRALEDDC